MVANTSLSEARRMRFEFDIYEKYHQELMGWFETNRTRLHSEGVSEQKIIDAAGLYRKLGRWTAEEYFLNRQELFTDRRIREEFIQEIQELQHNVLTTGQIKGISERFGMTREEAIHQCSRADQEFSKRPDLQKILADANYSHFTSRTMATGEDLLSGDLASFYTGGMQHLTASNSTIGHLVRNYVLEMVNNHTFTIIDMGSGSGATLAAIALGLADADSQLDDVVQVNLISIEGCHLFYRMLMTEVMPALRKKAENFRKIDMRFKAYYGDIRSCIPELECEGTQIYTANYVLHRISDKAKTGIYEIIGRMACGMDCAIFIGDIYRNTSDMPNRRFFNFGLNGPLNPGNDLGLMLQLMSRIGHYTCIADTELTRLAGVPQAVIETCRYSMQEEQGFMLAGYRRRH